MHENINAINKGQCSPVSKSIDKSFAKDALLTHLNFPELQRLPIQFKLSVGAVDDPLEDEADAMADKVMRMPEQNFIQGKCAHCEEEKVQRKPLIPFIQEREAGSNNTVASDAISSQIQSTKGSGSILSGTTKSFMESRFSADFSNVRIHADTNASQLSNQLNARAFTISNDIYFNRGKFQPETSAGKYLLAHELTHTLQQNNGSSSSIQRDLFAPPRLPADAETGLNGEQVDDAIAYNLAQFKDPYTIILLRDIMGGGIDETTSEINEEFVTAVAQWQAEHHLRQDGKVGNLTTRSFFFELVAESLFRDAILLLIDAYSLPWNMQLNDIIISAGANACNVNGNPSDATVSGGICPPNIGHSINLIVCRTSIPHNIAGYDHFVRIIGHELVHLLYCSSGGVYNNHETEFDAYAWEACSRNSAPLSNVDRVAHSNMALGEFAQIPAAGQTPARINMRDQLNNLVAAGGAGNCHN